MKILLPLFALCLLFSTTACKQYSYIAPGECQLIGTSEKLWIFFQIRQMVASTWNTYDAPSQYSKNEYGILVTIDNTGKTSVSKLLVPTNLSLYINLSHIFYYEDNVYIYGTAKDKYGYIQPGKYHLFIWDGNSFKEASIDDVNVKNILLEEVTATQEKTKRLSISNGATVVHEYYSVYYPKNFIWGKQEVELSLKYNDIDKYFEYIIKVSPLLKNPLVIRENYSIIEE